MTDNKYGENVAKGESRVLINVQRSFGKQDFFDIYVDYLKSKYGTDLSGLDIKPERRTI